MPQLSTTYDSKLKKKIFVLRGNEGYATTTDVVANLITDFDDYDNHISYCHVGLEIQVLREVGESTLLVTVNDEVISIPWKDSGMNELINTEYWNNQGIYWDNTNGKLIIGKKDDDHNINTGLFLLYDVEHSIKVQYLGNKRCLGSHCKPIVFTVPTPDTFTTTLTLTGSEPPVYDRGVDVSDLELLLECGQTLTSSKSVRIYDNDTLLTTVTATQDTSLTVDLSSYSLEDGLHTIKAVYDGDDESYGSDVELDISIGYVLSDVTYPSTLMSGNTGSISATIRDYFSNPIPDETVKISKYASSTYTDLSSTTSDDGAVSFTNVALTSDPWVFTYGNWHSGQYTTYIISANNISISTNAGWVYNGVSVPISGKILDGATPIQKSGVPIKVTYTDLDDYTIIHDLTTDSNGAYSSRTYRGAGKGTVNVTARITGTQISNSMQIHDYTVLWNNQLQIGDVTHYGTSLTNQSNGYKLMANQNNGYFVFQFPNSINKDYCMEFDVVSSFTNDGDVFMGVPIVNLSNMFTKGDNVKVTSEWQGNNVLNTIYVNNQAVGTGTADGIRFYYQFANRKTYLIINNVKIERIG